MEITFYGPHTPLILLRLLWQAAGTSQGKLLGSACKGVGEGLRIKRLLLMPGKSAAIVFFGAWHSGYGFLYFGKPAGIWQVLAKVLDNRERHC